MALTVGVGTVMDAREVQVIIMRHYCRFDSLFIRVFLGPHYYYWYFEVSCTI